MKCNNLYVSGQIFKFQSKIFIHFIFIAEWVHSVVMEACKPSRTETLPNEDFVRLERYIKEFSASYVYTHPASSKEPFTEKLCKSMLTNVKSSAYKNLLSQDKYKDVGNDGKFVDGNPDDDQQIFNFARDDISKNASTKRPAVLLDRLCSYIRSIGQISCGRIVGTCWLVTETMVITNHHVCMMIKSERNEVQNPNLPITVSFDYLYPSKREHVVAVEVDEERDPELENSGLDYKFLRLKEDEGLRDRVPLGPIVRSRQLQEGLVIIMGHPEGREMHEETCVVVSSYSWREKLRHRQEKFRQRQRDNGIYVSLHMTNDQLLRSAERYRAQGCLSYDTSLFSGASGSPVFDLNGNIVAMHTQGYTLDVNGRKCSLMEFGVQFNAICEDMRRRNLELVEELFPNYNLGYGEERMDEAK